MTKVAASLTLLALALAGCSSMGHQTTSSTSSTPQASAPVTTPSGAPVYSSSASATPGIQSQTLPYRPGSGVVEAVSEPRPPLASAGGTAPAPTGDQVVMRIRMDNGTQQYVMVDRNGMDFPIGTHVELTPDHQILRRQ